MIREAICSVVVLVGLAALAPYRGDAAEPTRTTGTVKAVDPNGRILILRVGAGAQAKDAEFEVSRKATVTLNGKSATIESMKAGQAVVVEYNADLGVATKIEASGVGAGAALSPELVKLTELNTDGMDFGPWVSGDGLTIFWSALAPNQEAWIWTASRRDPDSLFENPRRLFPGLNPTATANNLVVIFHDAKGSLQTASRGSVDQPFKRPTAIPELRGQPYCRRPSLSGDGLTLLFERLRGEGKGMEICVTDRTKPDAPWSRPESLPIDFRNAPQAKPSSPYLTRDGAALLIADFRKFGEGDSNFMVWTRSRSGGAFDRFEYLQTGEIPAFGTCPRYVEATRELFFNSDRAVSDRHDDKDKGAELFVIKNFMLPTAATPSAPTNVPAPRSK